VRTGNATLALEFEIEVAQGTALTRYQSVREIKKNAN
jgi:hypothetical protein